MSRPKGAKSRRGLPARIVDVLETHEGEWFSIRQLEAITEGDNEAVRRAAYRLSRSGEVEQTHRLEGHLSISYYRYVEQATQRPGEVRLVTYEGNPRKSGRRKDGGGENVGEPDV